MIRLENYKTTSPVLFIVFNRPEFTLKVFEGIRAARPERFYIAADGPRPDRVTDRELCEQTRAITQQADWDCKVFTLFREQNMGCKDAVSSAITWFFEHEEEGIILEDDCLPSVSFFRFCDEMLTRYRYDTRVRHITGSNLQDGQKRGDATYFFSNLTLVWGWASWRRVWKDYDKNLTPYEVDEVAIELRKIFDDPLIIESWLAIFKEVKAGKIDTWDYQLTFLNFFNNSLSVIPNFNLITNIGFGENATHTTQLSSKFANVPMVEIEEIKHPKFILPEKMADRYTLDYVFNIEERKKEQNVFRRRVKRKLKSYFKRRQS